MRWTSETTWNPMATKQYIAELEDGTRILSRKYGEGWSPDEAWAHFSCQVWDRAHAAGSATVIMGERYGSCLKRRVPPPPVRNMMAGEVLPGVYRIRES
jgi:hypothetical protein